MKYVVKTGEGTYLALQGPKGVTIVTDPHQATQFDKKEEAENAIPDQHVEGATVEEYKGK